MISIQISGIDGVDKELGKVVFKSRQAVADFAQEIYDRARAGADAHTKSGALYRSLQLRQYGTDGWEIYHDLAHARHALFVHWGTGIYGPKNKTITIKPKNKKLLRWVGKNGIYAFAKAVHQKGIKPDPWMVFALKNAEKNFNEKASKVAFGAR